MARRKRHQNPHTCRQCGARVKFRRDGSDRDRWRILNTSEHPSHLAPAGSLVLWNGCAWDPDELEAELRSRPNRPIDDDPHQEVLDLPWATLHRCHVLAGVADRTAR